MILSSRNIETFFQGAFEPTPKAIREAKGVLQRLWKDRMKAVGTPKIQGREGSSRFAALLARDLFGGQLSGNPEHLFVVLKDGKRIDLNEGEPDVVALGERAYQVDRESLTTAEYRAGLSYCSQQVRKWRDQAEEELKHNTKAAKPMKPKGRLEMLRRELGFGEHQLTKQGVPILVVENHISIAWFGTNEHFRVFTAFRQPIAQKKFDFKTQSEAAEGIKNIIANVLGQAPEPANDDQDRGLTQ
jgi:hypothetical protein